MELFSVYVSFQYSVSWNRLFLEPNSSKTTFKSFLSHLFICGFLFFLMIMQYISVFAALEQLENNSLHAASAVYLICSGYLAGYLQPVLFIHLNKCVPTRQCVSTLGLGPYLLQPYADTLPSLQQCIKSRWKQDGIPTNRFGFSGGRKDGQGEPIQTQLD